MTQRRIQSAQGRAASTIQTGRAPVAPPTPQEDYAYVLRDLKRILFIAGGLIVVMIALSFVL